MDLRRVKSLSIGGKPVAKLYVGGRLTWEKQRPQPTGDPYVETLGQSDSFWAAPMDQLGCIVAPAAPQHFAFSVDMRFDDGFYSDTFGIFGFTKTNVMYPDNMRNLQNDVSNVYAYAPTSVLNSNGIREYVSPGVRHLIKFDFDPEVGNSVDVDGSRSTGSAKTQKLPYDSCFVFGGISSSKIVASVTRPVKMRVYGIKIYQFHDLVADLVPYQDGGVVGMVDAVSGRKWPGTNLLYGE